MSGISPQQKKDPVKREGEREGGREEQGLKSKSGQTSFEKLHVLKKADDFTSY
jgi:hypothetical protein